MLNNQKIPVLILRIAIGINFLGHGLVRLPKLSGFRMWMEEAFTGSLIPIGLVGVWARVLPFLEFGIGVLILLGLFTRFTLYTGSIVLICLIFGSCLIEKWEWVGVQMGNILFIYFILNNPQMKYLSIDALLEKKSLIKHQC